MKVHDEHIAFPTRAVSCALQKQQNSLIAGLRATNELLTMQDHPEDKLKDSSLDRDSEGEPKVSNWN
jgi:hypothetical protein